MSIELVRRLLAADVAPRDVVEEALLEAVQSRRPFLAALAAQAPQAASIVEREIERMGAAESTHIDPEPLLVSACPAGMLRALGVVPVGHDPATGDVLAVTADPLDQHAAEELAYHLGSSVLLLHAPVAKVQLVLDGDRPATNDAKAPRVAAVSPISDDAEAELLALRPPRLPGFDVPPPPVWNVPPAPATGSEPPIPLVRRSLRPSAPRADAPAAAGDPHARAGLPPGTGQTSAPGVPKGSPGAAGDVAHSLARDALARASRPDDVVTGLLAGAEAVASVVVVLAAHGDEHRGRAASAGLGDSRVVRALVVPPRQTIVERSIDAGRYFGRIPSDASHRSLRELMQVADGDVYVVPIVVGDRVALVIVAAGLDVASIATRRIDELTVAAAHALERIVRTRKTR